MIRQFLIAVQFLTRFPTLRSLQTSQGELGRAAGYFPLVGVGVGGSGALLYGALQAVLPSSICVLAVLTYTALITHALHEDGLADAIDGFGGGWHREEMLRIMRDSRLGTYGALGLIFLVLVKYHLLLLVGWPMVGRWLILAHAASRWTALPLCLWLPYAREQGQGEWVVGRIGWPQMVMGTCTLGAAGWLVPWSAALAALFTAVLVVILTGLYYKRRLGGVTGDCLGATNQLTELTLYLVAVISSRL